MPLLMSSRPGGEADKAPDFEEFVKTLDDHQIGFLETLLLFAAEHDYGVVEELYMWVTNRWMGTDQKRREEVAVEVNEKFFTHKAFVKYMKEQEQAYLAGEEAEGLGLYGPDGKELRKDDEPLN